MREIYIHRVSAPTLLLEQFRFPRENERGIYLFTSLEKDRERERESEGGS